LHRRIQQLARPPPVKSPQVSDVEEFPDNNPVRKNTDHDMIEDESDDSMEVEEKAATQQPAQQPLAQAKLLTFIKSKFSFNGSRKYHIG